MKKLKELIENELKTLSIREFSRRTSIPTTSIYNYLETDVEPQRKSLERLATYFHQPLSYFYEDETKSTLFPDNPPTLEELRIFAVFRRARAAHPVVVEALVKSLEALDPGGEAPAQTALSSSPGGSVTRMRKQKKSGG
jgi:transcriptional regulator with XRE-family HTH domain